MGRCLVPTVLARHPGLQMTLLASPKESASHSPAEGALSICDRMFATAVILSHPRIVSRYDYLPFMEVFHYSTKHGCYVICV